MHDHMSTHEVGEPERHVEHEVSNQKESKGDGWEPHYTILELAIKSLKLISFVYFVGFSILQLYDRRLAGILSA